MRTTMRIEGGDQLARILDDLPKRVASNVLKGALTDGAEPMRSVISSNAPQSDEPPHVKDHIVIGSSSMRKGRASLAVGPSKAFEPRANIYPPILEHGNARQAAQPFMRPAFDSHGPRTVHAIIGALWRRLIERGFGSTRSTSGSGL